MYNTDRTTSRLVPIYFWYLKYQKFKKQFFCFLSLKESPFETRKNVFCFTSKALFIPDIIEL